MGRLCIRRRSNNCCRDYIHSVFDGGTCSDAVHCRTCRKRSLGAATPRIKTIEMQKTPNQLPDPTSPSVKPGDQMSAKVVYSGSTFTITIKDVTTGKSYTKGSTVRGAKRSSAEWIAEAPCCTGSGGILPLADFGTVLFGQDSTGVSGTNDATDSTHSGAIGTFPSASIEEINKTGS